jgi:hypothetical protein
MAYTTLHNPSNTRHTRTRAEADAAGDRYDQARQRQDEAWRAVAAAGAGL